ncbi:hypothetical protein CNMCM8980_007256 [Aspergillus fumigatiaffinis]|uniref:Uncharacterized protein n=1 Tax=Aspergillus fumigatiaffinis TaxID=340414 RepID=A0A8H4MBF2_9EURO|nr:hypothetical protein CNMCM5878_006933 [Aspergillus fumigatiaffinis]KAF4229193.1 hypothetical protein CNMCM6457_006539 [Aspergillus fumigatiaffinis]KAF4237163.1 hypothetical protein CNMCM6805_007112 [Aspergillus fumigatiaffinis]KAF4247484.1 hypothetical protein CNMCM8980_007256 [Aspergillus fumigatiaffinis]
MYSVGRYLMIKQGRSPYEPPEPPVGAAADASGRVHRRASAVHADGYVQHYDERGHPINPDSKSFGRELRRAKNDILSTMGIVVSEDRNAGAPNEQQKIDTIAAENDYGLIMATFDQVAVFLSSWWTSSLTGRIQAFKGYTNVPLLGIISRERSSMGIMGFYFSGIPAWAVSTCLSICRHHPLDRIVASLQNKHLGDDPWSRLVRASLNIFHSAARGTLLVLALQTYLYSLLQSLHLVQPYSLPGIQFLFPIGNLTAMHFPPLPTELSFKPIIDFALGLSKTPSLLVYLYVYLRPIIEIRIYRLIRRRLPKPSLADELSIKVAFENDLIDWMVPTLGRRSEEENRRSNLSLTEDVIYELSSFRDWMLSLVRLRPRREPSEKASSSLRDGRVDPLRLNMAELQTELNSSHYRSHLPQEENLGPTASPEELALQDHAEAAQSGSSGLNVSTHGPGQGADYNQNRVLSGEDDPISQSPAELSTGFPLEAATLGGPTTIPSAVDSSNPSADTHRPFEQAQSRLNSRSDTLLSRQSSPATSPPTSPRVRASLIHQNSDVITMQLEVLGNRNTHNQSPQNPRTANEIDRSDYSGAPADRRSIQDFLDNLLANQGQSLATVAGSEAVDSDGLSNMTTALSPETGDGASSIPLHDQDHGQRTLDEQPTHGTPATQPATTLANILPDSVEEPGQDDNLEPASDADVLHAGASDGELPPPLVDALASGDMPADPSSVPHRVTILSCHPVDSLASHLASIITTALFIPLESYYLRSLASSYLSSVGSPRRSDVRPLGAWGGGGSSSDIMAYMGKMALMVGLQAAVNASVWGVISGAAIRIGKRFCGWGNL